MVLFLKALMHVLRENPQSYASSYAYLLTSHEICNCQVQIRHLGPISQIAFEKPRGKITFIQTNCTNTKVHFTRISGSKQVNIKTGVQRHITD